MKPLARALDRAVPGFEQFRMRQRLVAATKDFCFLLFGELVANAAKEFAAMFLEPDYESLPLAAQSIPEFSPGGLFQLNRGIVDFAAVDLFVLLGDVGPGLEAQSDMVAATQARGGRQDVVAHAPEVDK